jgi:hypothetical protein
MPGKFHLRFAVLIVWITVFSTLYAQQPQRQANENVEGRAPHWIVPLPQPASEGSGQTDTARRPLPRERSKSKTKNERRNKKREAATLQSQPANLVCGSGGSYNPANFIQIFENTTAGKQETVYAPSMCSKGFQLSVDEKSSIEILPDRQLLGAGPALNKIYITAKLASGDTSKDVVVTGYSEVGKDKASMGSQSATAFQSAANVGAMLLNLAYTANDIIDYTYDQKSCQSTAQTPVGGTTAGSTSLTGLDENQPLSFSEWKAARAKNEAESRKAEISAIDNSIRATVNAPNQNQTTNSPGNCYLTRLQDRFRLYQPEVQAISAFFTDPENLAIVERVGTEVFWLDRDSLTRIAQQYQQNLKSATDTTTTPAAQNKALLDLLERTKLVNQDFADVRQEIVDQMPDSCRITDATRLTRDRWGQCFAKTIRDYAAQKEEDAIEELKDFISPGIISLSDNKAKDGDMLTVQVETVPATGSASGIPVVFELKVKKFGGKVQLSPSLLFIRRLGVTDAEATPPTGSTAAPVNRVNFAASPGVTFGWAYFQRGNSGWAKFLRGLGPGIGLNVTFMNFNDPSFDLTTSKFVNTTGTNVQVGSGIVGSLFDNKLQLSYGWNLNVENRRTYFGVGFGFLEIGKEVVKYIGK